MFSSIETYLIFSQNSSIGDLSRNSPLLTGACIILARRCEYLYVLCLCVQWSLQHSHLWLYVNTGGYVTFPLISCYVLQGQSGYFGWTT